MSGRIALQHALDRHAQRNAERTRSIRRGTVIDVTPLTVDVHGFDHPMTYEDDFEMSQWMVTYNRSVKLKVGDLVLLHQEDTDWTLVDVVSDAVVGSLGAGTTTGAAGAVPAPTGIMAARAYRSAAWNPSSGFQPIPVDTIEYDSGSNISLSQNAFIVSVAGYYQVSVGACVASSASAFNAQVGVVVNGSITHALEGAPNVAGQSMYPVMSASDIVKCVVGDKIQAYFWASATPPAMAQNPSNFLAVALLTAGAGPKGDTGAQGPPGQSASGDLTFTYTQVAAATTWNVTHSLNKYPSVSVVDSGNSLLMPDVHYTDPNSLTITFGSATSGKAFLN